MLSDGNEQFVVRKDRLLHVLLITLDAVEAERQPIREGKVDGLVEVETVIEARMISLRERDDEFARPLINCIDPDTGLLQLLRS